MQFCEIELTKFRQHASRTFHFPKGLSLIRGSNRIGKTSALEGLGYCLLGSGLLQDPMDRVITRGETSRMIDIETHTDGVPMASYRGDGLIAATPTGSTAYSLSAGGPILLPEIDAFLITPICPHTLTQRPVVLPRTSRVEMRVLPREGIGHLHVDGRASCPLEHGDRVLVSCSEHPARFVISPLRSRFDVLRAKLHWGAA